MFHAKFWAHSRILSTYLINKHLLVNMSISLVYTLTLTETSGLRSILSMQVSLHNGTFMVLLPWQYVYLMNIYWVHIKSPHRRRVRLPLYSSHLVSSFELTWCCLLYWTTLLIEPYLYSSHWGILLKWRYCILGDMAWSLRICIPNASQVTCCGQATR